MPLTLTQLATRVMRRARILDSGENQTAAESADVEAIIQSRYEAMKEVGRAPFPLTDIPTRYEDAFVSVMAVAVAAEFNTLNDSVVALGAQGDRIISQLNERKIDSRETRATDY